MTVTNVESERCMTAVQQQADVSRERAAPFETLREAFLHEEFLDVTAQLPLEYTAVGALPQRP